MLGYDDGRPISVVNRLHRPRSGRPLSRADHRRNDSRGSSSSGLHPTDPRRRRRSDSSAGQRSPRSCRIASATQPWSVDLIVTTTREFDRVFRMQLQETTTTTGPMTTQYQIPVGQIAAEYQKSAASPSSSSPTTSRPSTATTPTSRTRTTGSPTSSPTSPARTCGDDREAWRTWWPTSSRATPTRRPDDPRPTVVENVPLAYQPQAMPTVARRRHRADDLVQSSPASRSSVCLANRQLLRRRDAGPDPRRARGRSSRSGSATGS